MSRLQILVFGSVVLVGCGGSNNSQFSNGSNFDSRLGATGEVSTDRKPAAKQVPVYLTVTPAADSPDTWTTVKRLELSTEKSTQPIVVSERPLALRAQGFAGKRSIFLGMADQSEKLVRAQIFLDRGIKVAKDGTWNAGELTSDSKKAGEPVRVVLSFDKAAEFADAIVLDLQLAPDKGLVKPELKLANSSLASEETTYPGAFQAKKISEKTRVAEFIDWTKSAPTLEANTPGLSLDKGWVAVTYEPAARRFGTLAVDSTRPFVARVESVAEDGLSLTIRLAAGPQIPDQDEIKIPIDKIDVLSHQIGQKNLTSDAARDWANRLVAVFSDKWPMNLEAQQVKIARAVPAVAVTPPDQKTSSTEPPKQK